jgi:hypothetical protein
MPGAHERAEASGLSRRQLIARGAIAGGLVWAAPVIRTTAAYATTANGTELPCAVFYMVVINPAGQMHAAPPNLNGHEVPAAIRQWFTDNPGVTVQFPTIKPQLTGVSDAAAAVLLPAVTGPNAAARQCRMVIGWARKGDNKKEGYVDPDPPIAVEVGRRLIFPCPQPRADAVQTQSSATASDATATNPSTAGATGSIGADGAGGTTANNNGQPSSGHGPGFCFDQIYLIYCCPR